MNNTIKINGNDFTGDVEGVDDLVLTYSLDDSLNVVDLAISSTLIFRGAAYNYLQPLFFAGNFDSSNATADIQITSNCCDNVFNLKIRADASEICFETCEITTASFEDTPDIIAAKKLQELPIFANLRTNPKMPVCVDYGFWGTAILRLYKTVLDVVLSIGSNVSWFGWSGFETQLTQLNNFVTGCNAFASTFYIRDILEDGLDLVGLQLSSSILESGDYANAVWLDPSKEIQGGGFFKLATCPPQDQLVGVITYAEFLEVLKTVFNADYRIRNGILYFERMDFFFDNANQAVDVEAKYNDNKKGSLPCYTYTGEEKYAAGRFVYQKDDIESAGNKTWFQKYRINQTFNEPFNPTLKGLKEVDLPIAPSSFTQDGFQESEFDGDRPAGVLVIESDALLERSLPKIMVIKGKQSDDDDFCNAQVVGTVTNQDFNYPMWLRTETSAGVQETGQLYDDFHSICDSRISPVFLYQLEEFEYIANCDEKQLIINNRLNVHAVTRLGKGFPSEIDIEVNSGKITMKEVKILM